ncbi:hypothetical protein GOODEAATRI_002613 [Goodea atripinnis]|uniref:Uncharacterized protein n=1 Tax=Goodea atripinnis TaxID=208336 RepID=A0ABV0MEJ7_9TELE
MGYIWAHVETSKGCVVWRFPSLIFSNFFSFILFLPFKCIVTFASNAPALFNKDGLLLVGLCFLISQLDNPLCAGEVTGVAREARIQYSRDTPGGDLNLLQVTRQCFPASRPLEEDS